MYNIKYNNKSFQCGQLCTLYLGHVFVFRIIAFYTFDFSTCMSATSKNDRSFMPVCTNETLSFLSLWLPENENLTTYPSFPFQIW